MIFCLGCKRIEKKLGEFFFEILQNYVIHKSRCFESEHHKLWSYVSLNNNGVYRKKPRAECTGTTAHLTSKCSLTNINIKKRLQ